PGSERTEISDPDVIFTIDGQPPGMIDAAAVEVTDLRAVRAKRVHEVGVVTLRSDPRISLRIEGDTPELLTQQVPELLHQLPVHERVFCNRGGGRAEPVCDPGASIGGNSNVERRAAELLGEKHRLMRIAGFEHIRR